MLSLHRHYPFSIYCCFLKQMAGKRKPSLNGVMGGYPCDTVGAADEECCHHNL